MGNIRERRLGMAGSGATGPGGHWRQHGLSLTGTRSLLDDGVIACGEAKLSSRLFRVGIGPRTVLLQTLNGLRRHSQGFWTSISTLCPTMAETDPRWTENFRTSKQAKKNQICTTLRNNQSLRARCDSTYRTCFEYVVSVDKTRTAARQWARFKP